MRYLTLWFASALTLVLLIVGGQMVTVSAAESNGTAATIDAVKQDSLQDRLVQRVQTSWPWYLTRAAGIVAAVSLIILMLSGIGQITGNTFRFLDPLTAWATHRALGIVFGVSVLVHMGAGYLMTLSVFR